MKNINRIYWQEDKIGMITNNINAKEHSHWMLQLFLSLDKEFNITVNNNTITCRCIVVDKNVVHSFQTNNKIYFSCMIEPTSIFASQITKNMNNLGYCICDYDDISWIQEKGLHLVQDAHLESYLDFMNDLAKYLHISSVPLLYDERITELLHLLETCSCHEHTISSFATKVSLSPSRLSHLFKEQVGVPLKSYIVLHQIKQAFMYLLQGKTITDAALLAGFDSPSHFATTVKRVIGMSASLSLKDSEFLQVSKF